MHWPGRAAWIEEQRSSGEVTCRGKNIKTLVRACPGRVSPWPLERGRRGGTPTCTWGTGHDHVTLGEGAYGCAGRFLPTSAPLYGSMPLLATGSGFRLQGVLLAIVFVEDSQGSACHSHEVPESTGSPGRTRGDSP